VVDNPDVEAGYSPVAVCISRSSSSLGDELKGGARERWDAAGSC